jgi:predicted nucleic acid-binding protein
MIVVDASVFIDVITKPATSENLIAILAHEKEFAAPHIVDLEVMNGLRKHVSGKRMSKIQAKAALSVFLDLKVLRHPTWELNGAIWQMHANVTPYDAAYVQLALTLNIPFLTRDGKLTSAVSRLPSLKFL